MAPSLRPRPLGGADSRAIATHLHSSLSLPAETERERERERVGWHPLLRSESIYIINCGCGHPRVVDVESLQGVVMATNDLQTPPPDLISERILQTRRRWSENRVSNIIISSKISNKILKELTYYVQYQVQHVAHIASSVLNFILFVLFLAQNEYFSTHIYT